MTLKHSWLCITICLAISSTEANSLEECTLRSVEQLIFDGKYQEAENCALTLIDTEIDDEIRVQLLTSLGEALLNQSRDGQAYLEEALQLEISKGLDSLLIGRTLLILSKNAANLGRFDKGLSYNYQSIEIREKLLGPDHWELADNHNMLGYCHRLTSNYELALTNYEEANQIWESHKGELKASMGPTYDGLGIVTRVLSRPTESLEYLSHSLQLKKELLGTEIHPSISNTLQHIGRNYYDLHQYNQALDVFSKVLEIRRQTLGDSHVNVGVAYGLLGNCHAKLGNYDLAIDLYKRKISIFKEFLPSDYLLTPYTELADAYKNNGQSDAYLETLAKSEAVINASARFGGQYLVSNYLLRASYFQSIGEEVNRLMLLEQSSKLVDEKLPGLAAQRSRIDFHLGNYYLDHGAFEKAQQLFDHALKRKASFYGLASPVLYQNYLVLGDLHHEMGHFTTAVDYYQKSLELQFINKSIDSPTIPEVDNILVPLEGLVSISKMASSYFAIYQQDTTQLKVGIQSTEYYLAALRYLRFLRNSFQSDEAKIRISNLFSTVSSEALDITFSLYQKTKEQAWLQKAFWISEMRRSQVLVEAINEGQLKSLAKIPDTLLSKEIACYGELAYLRQKLGNADEEQTRVELEKRLFQKGQELDQLKTEIRLYYPEYHRVKYETSSLNIFEFQKSLKKREILLAYSISDHFIYRFQIGKEQALFDQVHKPDNWSELLQNHHQSITDYDFIVNQARKADHLYRQSARRLYELLIPEFSMPDKDDQLLTIVPHDSLHNVNFALLLTDKVEEPLNFRNYSYLLRKQSIRYAPSVSILLTYNRPFNNSGKGYIGFAASPGDNDQTTSSHQLAIPGAQKEIRAVGHLFKGKTLIGPMATEENFRKEASNFNVIHLAMHGSVDQRSPLNSRLHFSGEADSLNDGTLHLDEIYGIPLNAELAVLSACDTGDGKLSNGEGLMSMARAFNYAGCRSVLMSQWKVADEESVRLVIDFFGELKQGHTKSAALRAAQLNYLEEVAGNMRTHPFFWAGFRLMGDDSELTDEDQLMNEWLIVFLSLGLVLFMLFRRKTNGSFFGFCRE